MLAVTNKRAKLTQNLHANLCRPRAGGGGAGGAGRGRGRSGGHPGSDAGGQPGRAGGAAGARARGGPRRGTLSGFQVQTGRFTGLLAHRNTFS